MKSFFLLNNNNYVKLQEEQGTSFIEIKDNGKGIPHADAAFVGLQAYTSKITDFSDLGKFYFITIIIVNYSNNVSTILMPICFFIFQRFIGNLWF